MLRVLGLWLLYAFVGILMVVGGDSGGVDEKRSPTRFRTKVVSTASGFLLLVGAVGFYTMQDPSAGAPETSRLMTIGGFVLGSVAAFVAWAMIHKDLERKKKKKKA
jgi:drug/metabolite transporter (DMT)-like permease